MCNFQEIVMRDTFITQPYVTWERRAKTNVKECVLICVVKLNYNRREQELFTKTVGSQWD